MTPSIGYFAGFFDGEGSVSVCADSKLNKAGRRDLWLRITVANTDPTPLHFFKEAFGGTINGGYILGKNKTPCFQWRAVGRVAEKFLETIIEHLVVKRHDAEIGLAFQRISSRRITHRNHAFTPEQILEREGLRQDLIKSHGPASRAAEVLSALAITRAGALGAIPALGSEN